MKKDWDVIIVGAGPSGSACAKILAENNLDVLIVEKNKLPRKKLCTGIVSALSVEIIEREIGDFPRALCIRNDEVKNCKFKTSHNAPFLKMNKYDTQDDLSVFRSNFDYWLTLKASEYGAEVIERCRFIDYNIISNNIIDVRLAVKNHNGITVEEVVRTKYLVGADGLESKVRSLLFPERNEKYSRFFCRQDYYYGSINLERGYYYLFLSVPNIEGTMWVFFKDDFIVVGMPSYDAKTIKKNKEIVIDYLKQNYNFKPRKLLFGEAGRENMYFNIQKAEKNELNYIFGKESLPILLIGEASEMADVLGEGIPVSLESGCNAAKAIIMHNNGGEKDLLGKYEAMCQPMISRIKKNWTDWYVKFGKY